MNRVVQQVNLYQPMFRKEHVAFSVNSLMLVILAASLCMTGIYGYAWWQNRQVQKLLTTVQARNTHLVQQAGGVDGRLAEPGTDQDLESRIRLLGDKQKNRKSLLDKLNSQTGGNHVGFSDYLQGLGRQVLPGMWFRDINVSGGGALLELEGSVLQAELVPQLLRNLHDEPAFTGKVFRVVRLNRQDEGTGEIRFLLLTSAGGQKP